ncbi:MAG: mycothiol system anti-sigma-R factor [Acidimicrobiales bacterium]|jgi:mycothiol system anti-sigma-R factor
MTDDPCAEFGSGECQEALQELYHYLDGHLTVERRTVIKSHLDFCGHCGSTYAFEFELRQVVSRRCNDQVPDRLKARIFQAIVDAQHED